MDCRYARARFCSTSKAAMSILYIILSLVGCHRKFLCRTVVSSSLASAAAAFSSSLILDKCLLYTRCSKHVPHVNTLNLFNARTRHYHYHLNFTNNTTSIKRLDELVKFTQWVGGRTKIQTQVVRIQILELMWFTF